jgi:hypothetical protein
VRVASAYITDSDLLLGATNRKVRILTSLLPMDVISRATSLDSLRSLVDAGVECRCLSDRPRLHAKVYIFGEQYAVVTSANLTANALNHNIEVGVELTGGAVRELADWFDAFWKKAPPLDVAVWTKWQQDNDGLRRESGELQKKVDALPPPPDRALPVGESREELRDLLENAPRFFCCNSNRREGSTLNGRYVLEEKMRSQGYAAAWKKFNFLKHKNEVKRGDAIFMFAKAVGIIGIGRARAECEELQPGAQSRIGEDKQRDEPECRVPVEWLAWRVEGAFRYRGPNSTFWRTTEKALLDAVKTHFLSLPVVPSS